MVFQILDMTAYGGLREMNGFSGSGKAFKLDDFAEYI
jgi:hypothetical protein